MVGGLPLFDILQKKGFLRRGAPSRTTRQEDPFGYWRIVILTTLLALAAFAAGIAIFAGVLQP